jgi:PAS domain S-box-containing protein
MTLPFFPIWLVDVVGSIMMTILSFLCLGVVFELKRSDQYNVIWTYLLWLCFGLAAFAISRSVGHILKHQFLFSGREVIWDSFRPFSGAINTLTFVFVASVTLFFEHIWKIHQQVLKDKQDLQLAHEKLFYLNQNLEDLVAKRTESLAASESKYRRIFEVSKDMILVSKKDGLIVDMNPAGYKMLGYNESEFFDKEKYFQNGFAKDADWTTIQKTLEEKGFISSFEIELKRKDDSHIRCLLSGSLDRGSSETQMVNRRFNSIRDCMRGI